MGPSKKGPRAPQKFGGPKKVPHFEGPGIETRNRFQIFNFPHLCAALEKVSYSKNGQSKRSGPTKCEKAGDIEQTTADFKFITTHSTDKYKNKNACPLFENEKDVGPQGEYLDSFSDRAIHPPDVPQNLGKAQILAKFEQSVNDQFYEGANNCQNGDGDEWSFKSSTTNSEVSNNKVIPYRNMVSFPKEICKCTHPRLVIKALGDKERKHMQRFSFFQFFTISNWVNTGHQNFSEVIKKEEIGVRVVQEQDQELPGMRLLGNFLPDKNAMIMPLQVEGVSILATIDTGAAITICSDTFFALNINPFFQQTLRPYQGPKLHSCQNKHLSILGIYTALFKMNKLEIYHPIVIYESSLKELLIGYDMISKYNMTLSRRGLYAPQHIDNGGQFRVGQDENPYFTMYSKVHHIIQPYSAKNLEVYVNREIFQEKVARASPGNILWVAHSQDHEYCPKQENLAIFFQAVTITDCEAVIYFHNNTDFPITIAKDEEIGALEQMSQISLKDIHEQKNEDMLQIFRSMIDIPRYRELQERESDLFIDLPDQQLPPIEWQELDCPPIPGLKEKLIRLCQKYQNIFGLDKYDVKSINMGSSKYVRLSVNTGTSPVNQMAIPTHNSLLPAAKKFLQTLLDRNLIGFAPQKCAWSSSLFFVRKRTEPNVVDEGDTTPDGDIEPVPRVAESAGLQKAGSPKKTKMDRFSKKAPNHPKVPEMAKNGQNGPEMEKNGRKGPKMAKNDQNGPKMQENEKKIIKPPDIRAIVDLRGVNQKLKINSLSVWPIMSCRDIINQLQSKNYVSQLDCLIAYWQVPLSSKNGQNILAFNFQGMHFVPKKLQHGMNCSMSIFTRIITKILIKAKLDPYVQAFCDNLIVATETLEQHLDVLEKLFSTLDHANIKIHYNKQNLCHNKSIKLFGYILDLEKKLLSPDGAKLREISLIGAPKTKKQCRKYTGMFAMWSTIIPNLAKILSPIYANCSEKAIFKWGPEQEKSWQDSKNLLIQHFAVALPDFTKQFIIVSDSARKLGCSNTVFQRNNEGKLYPISHFSKVFKGSEVYFSQAKAEMYSLVLGLNMNIMYFCIAGSQRHLALTDAICLQWAAKYCYQNAQLYNWSTFIFSLPLKVLALAQNSPLIIWSDMWSRPQQVKKAIENVYNDKKYDPKQLLTCDFSGLPALNIEDIFKICTKFNKILEKYEGKMVKKCWEDNKEDLQFPEKPSHVFQISPNQVLLLEQEKSKKSSDFFSVGIHKICQNHRNRNSRNLCHPGDGQILETMQIFQTHLAHISLPILAKLQNKDPLCCKMKGKVDLCVSKEGLLFKVKDGRSKLIIPKTLTFQLLWSLHNFNTIYHISYKKLKAFTDKHFVIQSFSGTLQKILATCEHCLLNTKAPWPRQDMVGPTILISHPFAAIHFDFLVVNSSFKKYPSFLTVTDYFSNASWFYAANHNISGKEFVDMFFSHIAQVCGIPNCINHDGQAAFISEKLATLCKVLRVKQFVSTRAASNRSEAKNAIALKMARSICQNKPLEETCMPALGTLLSLSYNALPIALHKAAPIDILHNMGYNKPRLHKLNFLGLPSRESKDAYHLRLAHLKEVMMQIKNRMYQRMKDAPKVSIGLQKGDFCLVARKSKGHAPAAKLKTRYFKKPFRVYQLKRRSAVLVPFNPIKIVPSEHMRKGRRPERPKKIIIPWERIKKINNPFPLLDLPFSEAEIDKFASFLQKKASKTEIDRVQLVNSSPNLDPKVKKIKDFLCLPLNPALNLKNHQRQKALKEVENFRKLKEAMKSENFKNLFEQKNVFKVTDGSHMYDFVSSLNSSLSFHASTETEGNERGKTEEREKKFFRPPRTPRVPSSMFHSAHPERTVYAPKKDPQNKFFAWLKNQPKITHFVTEGPRGGSESSGSQYLQGRKVNTEDVVSGISILLEEVYMSDDDQMQNRDRHSPRPWNRNKDEEKDDNSDNEDEDEDVEIDKYNGEVKTLKKNKDDSLVTISDNEDNSYHSATSDRESINEKSGVNNDNNDGESEHLSSEESEGSRRKHLENQHLQSRGEKGSGSSYSFTERAPKESMVTPIWKSIPEHSISEINVLESDGNSRASRSQKSVSFNEKKRVISCKAPPAKTGAAGSAGGKVVTQRSTVKYQPKQHSLNLTMKKRPNQNSMVGLEKRDKSAKSELGKPHLVIQNPDPLISDRLLKSSGTPKHVKTQMPFESPTTTNISKNTNRNTNTVKNTYDNQK